MPNSVTLSVPATPPSPLPHSRYARSQNRRFHVRFPGVDSEEHLLNYFSCALVADILLQGYLYITENYFAFYSNIFGRKTQILIPVCDVIKVTKERTAKIIPNAVGIYTEEGKYIFGSLLSRNTTYRLMHYVWLKSADPDSTDDSPSENSDQGTSDEPVLPPPSPVVVPPDPEEIDLALRRLSRRKSDIFPRISAKAVRRQGPPPSSVDPVVEQIALGDCRWEYAKGKECLARTEENSNKQNNVMPKTTLILLSATLLLVILFLFATILVYRVSIVHRLDENWPARSVHKVTDYLELLKEQQETVENEIRRITTTLKIRMDEIGQVRQSISQLMGIAGGSSCQTLSDGTKRIPKE